MVLLLGSPEGATKRRFGGWETRVDQVRIRRNAGPGLLDLAWRRVRKENEKLFKGLACSFLYAKGYR
jgi:hypothetical protein